MNYNLKNLLYLNIYLSLVSSIRWCSILIVLYIHVLCVCRIQLWNRNTHDWTVIFVSIQIKAFLLNIPQIRRRWEARVQAVFAVEIRQIEWPVWHFIKPKITKAKWKHNITNPNTARSNFIKILNFHPQQKKGKSNRKFLTSWENGVLLCCVNCLKCGKRTNCLWTR